MIGDIGKYENPLGLEYDETHLLPYYRKQKELTKKEIKAKAQATYRASLLHKMSIEPLAVRRNKIKRIAQGLCLVGTATEEVREKELSDLLRKIARIEDERLYKLKCADTSDEEYGIKYKYEQQLRSSYDIAQAISMLGFWISELEAAKKTAELASAIEFTNGGEDDKEFQKYLEYRQMLETVEI